MGRCAQALHAVQGAAQRFCAGCEENSRGCVREEAGRDGALDHK